jgi:hypothetical protein
LFLSQQILHRGAQAVRPYLCVYQQLTQLVLSWGESPVGAVAPTEYSACPIEMIGVGLLLQSFNQTMKCYLA